MALVHGGLDILVFGGLYTIPYFFIANSTFAITYWIRGLPYDIIHMVGNYFIMISLGKILYSLLIRLKESCFK